ncbi:MAG: DNA polymerase III subunit gamma/tau [Bacteroidales bacterium]
MNNFIVSARKYRPSTFDTVVGQESITSTLKNAIRTSHLAQSYLFCGPRGVGKTTCARILAKTINCLNLTESIEACDECESCRAFNTSRSFNIHELDAASNNKVDDIRTLTELVRIPPQVGRYSIYIIDEVHMLSTSAFNAFLKTLEEPPAHAIFILATTEKQKIIPTILSRCQIFDFNRITVEDIVKRLEFVASSEGIDAEPEALHIIAQKADGAMRDALSIFDQIVSFSGGMITYAGVIENLNVLDYEYYLRIADAFSKGDLVTSLLIFSEILEKGFDGHNFVSGLSSHYRNLLVSKSEKTLPLLEVGSSIKDRYREQSARTPLPYIYKALEILGNCDAGYRLSRNPRLHVEIAMVRLAALNQEAGRAEKSQDAEKDNPAVKESEPVKSDNTGNHIPGSEQSKAVPQPVSRPKEAPGTLERTDRNVPGEKDAGIPPDSSVQSDRKVAYQEPTRSFSIREKLQNGGENPARVDDGGQGKAETDDNIKAESQFDSYMVLKSWVAFGESLGGEHPRMYSIVKGTSPSLSDEGGIVVELSTEAQKEFFDHNFKQNVIRHFRKELKNSSVKVESIVSESEGSNIPYTDEEKYNYLKTKNPAIDDLKRELGLELE